MGENAAVHSLIAWLDKKLSAGEFDQVDQFLATTDVEAITSATFLLAICNYVHIAKVRGDVLVHGSSFRERAGARMVVLIGAERAERLLRNR